MILALAGQFKQLSHEPEKFRWLNGIRTHDLCDAGAVLLPTELWSHTVESRSICWVHVFPWKDCIWKECYMQCGVWNQMKIWSSHLLDNLSNCLMNLKNSGDSTGFEPLNYPASARIISSFDFKHRTAYNIPFMFWYSNSSLLSRLKLLNWRCFILHAW